MIGKINNLSTRVGDILLVNQHISRMGSSAIRRFIYLFIQHFYSALLINKYALIQDYRRISEVRYSYNNEVVSQRHRSRFLRKFRAIFMHISVNLRTIFLRNDFIIVRLSHLRNPAKNLRFTELRRMRNPPLILQYNCSYPSLVEQQFKE